MGKLSALLVCAGVIAALAACGRARPEASFVKASGAPAGDDIPSVLATIGNDDITLADVQARAGDDLDKLDMQYRRARYTIVNNALQTILRERVIKTEADRQGKTVEQLAESVYGKSITPSDVEIGAWFSENPDKVGGRTLAQIRPQIAEYLRQTRLKEAGEKLEQQLYAQKKVVVHLTPFRIPFDNAKAPTLGPANAPVTLVEFSDFQCPYCAQFHPRLEELHRKYGDKLQIVYRHFPLTAMHQNAFKAAEASMCANEQGKFWEMHDVMFTEQNRLTVADLKEKAGRIGLDQKKFNTCMESGKYVEQVENDLREGGKAGVTGTPALFVNGVYVEGGAVTLATISATIDKELARVAAASAP